MYNATNSTPKPTENPWPYLPIKPRDGLILFCIFIIGASMNIIGLILTYKIRRRHKSRGNDLIIALGISDFSLLFFGCIPTLLVYVTNMWVGGNPLCQFQGFVANSGIVITAGLTVVLAVERMIAVTSPIIYRTMSQNGRHWLFVIGVIVTGIFMGGLPLVGVGKYQRNLTGTYCTLDWFATGAADIAGAVIFCIFGSLMLFIIIYCNIRVFLGIRKMRKKRRKLSEIKLHNISKIERPATTANQSESKRVGMERNFSVTVLAMSMVFLLLWFPYVVRIVFNLAQLMRDGMIDVMIVRLALINSVINPFIYTFLRKKAREEFFSWFKNFKTNFHGSSTSSSSVFHTNSMRETRQEL